MNAIALRLIGGQLGVAACLALALGCREQSTLSFGEWAAVHAVPLDTIEPAADTHDLERLASAFGSARVIALGEPSHGNHEPLAFRNRLFRYLVEDLSFTAIALETGLAESLMRLLIELSGSAGVRERVRGRSATE